MLLLNRANKLAIEWQGPFRVVRGVSDAGYVIGIRGKQKMFYENMLAKFHKAEQTETDLDMVSVHHRSSGKITEYRQ